MATKGRARSFRGRGKQRDRTDRGQHSRARSSWGDWKRGIIDHGITFFLLGCKWFIEKNGEWDIMENSFPIPRVKKLMYFISFQKNKSLLRFDSGTTQNISNLLLLNKRSTVCSYFYHVKRYIYNSISFAPERGIITYVTINLVSVLRHWLVFSWSVTRQIEGVSFSRIMTYLALSHSKLQCRWNDLRRFLCEF